MADPEEKRAALNAEAERLERERLQREREVVVPRFSPNAGAEQRLGRALRQRWMLVVAIAGFVVGGMLMLSPATGASAPNPIGFPFALAGLVALAGFLSGPLRFRRWEASLPFKLQGWEQVLSLNQAVSKARLEVVFKDTAAPEATLRELARARLGEHTRLEDGALVNADLDIQPANGPTARWLQHAVNEVLLEVHQAYAIERVRLTALHTVDFAEQSGD
ncbi:MAG: hypothetical protein IPJ65_01820 [Archangiaceae bacterium]|nr:hypothetical protein [Archangiaceae bacterium]